jgi:hypothetical protein
VNKLEKVEKAEKAEKAEKIIGSDWIKEKKFNNRLSFEPYISR